MTSFTEDNTYNKHKDKVYSIILETIKNYKGSLTHFMDMPWLNFTLTQEILKLNDNFIVHGYEYNSTIHKKQKELRKELNISGHRLRLFNEQVHLSFVNKPQRKYAFSFLDFCGRMCQSMSTSLAYANSDYIALTVRLGREQGYWKDMLKFEERHITHKKEFHRAGLIEFRAPYDYPSDQGTTMRVYFLKKI